MKPLKGMDGERVHNIGVKGAWYVWMVGGVEGGDVLERGWEMREGWVNGPPEVVDSTRAELMGVVGAEAATLCATAATRFRFR